MPMRDRYCSAPRRAELLRATPELIGEIAQNPTFSKELEETLMLEVIQSF
jgi:hypothetical protein